MEEKKFTPDKTQYPPIPERPAVKEDDATLNELRELRKEVAALTDLLRRLPEIQAAVFFQLKEEVDAARMRGKKTSDIWIIAPPEKR